MGYATLQDVKDTIPHVTLDATSRPPAPKVEEWCEVLSKELDAILTNIGYQTPITGANSLAMLKEMVSNGVAAKVLRSQFSALRDPETLGYKSFVEEFKMKLEKLQSPDCAYMLPDAVKLDVQSKLSADVESMVTQDSEFYDSVRVTRDQVF